MSSQRKKYSANFKLKAVLKVLKGDKTSSQLAGELGVNPMMLSKWKKHFFEGGAQIFQSNNTDNTSANEQTIAELFEQIGRLKMENEWLKKKLKVLS
jgi:transposase